MKRIPLTQGLYALVDDEDYEYLRQWKWYAKRVGRCFYAVRGRRKSEGPGPKTVLMHRVVLSPRQGTQVDHINGNGLDNQRENLRAATAAINQANHVRQKHHRKHNLPMGVHPSGYRFQALIQIDRAKRYLGTFGTAEDASAAYQTARRRRIGCMTEAINAAP